MAGGTVDFPSSHWSLIAQAGAADPEAAHQALTELCNRYWYPIYAFVRRQVRSADQAEDLTQGFFADLLRRKTIRTADPGRGRFRTYLLTCCRRYVVNDWRAGRSLKNGAGVPLVRLDFEAADARYGREPADPADPEVQFRRGWALTLLDQTFAALQDEYAAAGRGELFARLRPGLTGDLGAARHAEVGAAVGLSEAAVRKAFERLKKRFGAELRRRVGETVADPAEVDDEIRDLFAAVAQPVQNSGHVRGRAV